MFFVGFNVHVMMIVFIEGNLFHSNVVVTRSGLILCINSVQVMH